MNREVSTTLTGKGMTTSSRGGAAMRATCRGKVHRAQRRQRTVDGKQRMGEGGNYRTARYPRRREGSLPPTIAAMITLGGDGCGRAGCGYAPAMPASVGRKNSAWVWQFGGACHRQHGRRYVLLEWVTRATTTPRGLAGPRAFASANYCMALMLAEGGGLGRAPTSNPNETRTRSSMSVAAALARCTFSPNFVSRARRCSLAQSPRSFCAGALHRPAPPTPAPLDACALTHGVIRRPTAR